MSRAAKNASRAVNDASGKEYSEGYDRGVRVGVRRAIDIASQFDSASRHDYLVSECIAAKLNLQGAPMPQPSPFAAGVSPVPMLLWCPACNQRHLDEGVFATKVHHMHACQACGMVWRPAVVPTVGVAFLPGFKNDGRT